MGGWESLGIYHAIKNHLLILIVQYFVVHGPTIINMMTLLMKRLSILI